MNLFVNRFIKLILGLALFSIGIVMTIQADIGYAPWDVFHAGFANQAGITIGIASIIVGIAICIIVYLLGEKIGLGTLFNMVLIGLFLDGIMYFNLIPKASNFFIGILMITIGMFIISLGSYFYIGSGFGAGPRDALMVGIRRKTKLPVGICRVMIELSAALIGYFMGGLIGIGTVISAFTIGICIQTTFDLLHFDSTQVKHETLKQTFESFK